MTYPALQALHIIFVVTWFSGLFYIVRLFVYHAEAEQKSARERDVLQPQYRVMEKRLWYGITWPSMILTLIFGIWLLVEKPTLLQRGYMHLKLLFVALLVSYHLLNQGLFGHFQRDRIRFSPWQLRLWNEVATLFLVAIVFIIMMRDMFNWIWGTLGILGLGGLLYLASRIYRNQRQNNTPAEAESAQLQSERENTGDQEEPADGDH